MYDFLTRKKTIEANRIDKTLFSNILVSKSLSGYTKFVLTLYLDPSVVIVILISINYFENLVRKYNIFFKLKILQEKLKFIWAYVKIKNVYFTEVFITNIIFTELCWDQMIVDDDFKFIELIFKLKKTKINTKNYFGNNILL